MSCSNFLNSGDLVSESLLNVSTKDKVLAVRGGRHYSLIVLCFNNVIIAGSNKIEVGLNAFSRIVGAHE